MSYINVKNVSRTIKGQLVLNNINLSLENKKIYGFRGKNGSGKTMFFRALLGLIKIDNGIIEINNTKIGINRSFPESTGIIIEYPGFIPEYSGFKNLKLLASIQNKITDNDIENTLLLVGLDPKDKRKVKKYSLGMKQRLGIAQAIMEKPNLLVLDEPTNALDIDGVKDICKLLIELKKQGTTILLSSHDKETLELVSDEIYKVEYGEISKE